MKKKSNFGVGVMLIVGSLIIVNSSLAAVQKIVLDQEKYIDQYFQVDQNGQTKVKIFLGGQQIAEMNNQALDYFLYDHLGSVTAVLDQNGNIKEQNDYQSFGLLQCRIGGADNQRQFIGKENDQETDWQYFGQRYYDPLLGRFSSIDPLLLSDLSSVLANPQGLNSYSYAYNNPISFIDFFGLSTATVNPMPENGWQIGDEMGQFNGVTAYYNGIGSAREARSCVEYAKRYWSEVYGINDVGSVGTAKNMWNIVDTINKNLAEAGSIYTVVQHNNGQEFLLPQTGDLLFWTSGPYGHVMVVSEANFDNQTNKGYVEIMDQNASNKALSRYDIDKTEEGYSVIRQKNVPMAGWLSPVNKNTSATNNQVSAIGPSARAQSLSFFQRMWQDTRQFFRKIF
ncbi:MAG: RHS repeat-associated core domain-containing protein [Patescibacteria group bacterium]|jgi:RHS repeat-associated protein